jgi:hypothetical protein
LGSITIAPANQTIPVTTTGQLSATGIFTDGSTQDLTDFVTWSSSTPAVATISNAGLINASSLGTTTITAAFGAVSGTTTVTVSANISGLDADHGPAGTQLFVLGSHFGASRGSNQVLYGSNPVTVNSWSDTLIVTTLPSNIRQSEKIYVVENGVSSNGFPFNLVLNPPQPSISGLSSNSGGIGDAVQITGANFGDKQGANTVTFNNVPASVSLWSDGNIFALVPPEASTGALVVTVAGQ